MQRLLIATAIAAALVFAAASISFAAYMYTDDNGTPVVVDCLEKVPQKHRAASKQLNEDTRRDGFTPSFEQARNLEKGDQRGLWYRYEEMKWHERKFLVARAGLLDLKEVLKAISHWIGFAAFFLAISFMVTFRMVSGRIAQTLICICLVAGVGSGLFYEYMRSVENRKSIIAQKIEQIRGQRQSENMEKMLAALGK